MLHPIKDVEFLKSFLKGEVYLVDERKRYPLVVVFDEPKNDYLNPEEEVFLEKILQAVNIQLDTVKLINTSFLQAEDDFQQFSAIPAEKLINFGADLKKLNLKINLPIYQLTLISDVTFLQADNLPTISQSQEQKKLLWGALKQMFL